MIDEHPAQAGTDFLRAASHTVLRDNDRGGYTVPSSRPCPFRWSWDAGVTALGWI